MVFYHRFSGALKSHKTHIIRLIRQGLNGANIVPTFGSSYKLVASFDAFESASFLSFDYLIERYVLFKL